MARVLGYGGLANTNGTRNFGGKAAADDLPAGAPPSTAQLYMLLRRPTATAIRRQVRSFFRLLPQRAFVWLISS